jgi:hypothetical protein
MNNEIATEIEGLGLLAEVERYLAAVDAFRAAGLEPEWLPEPVPAELPASRRGRRARNRMQRRLP